MFKNKKVLDVCCGSRMFYFDKNDERVLFADNRKEDWLLKDKSSKGGFRNLIINPDIQLDFTCLPFEDDSFSLVVFDPPHLVNCGKNSWLAKKYGVLGAHWKEDIKLGFVECFRVICDGGTLIFKWNESQVKLSEILKLTDRKPIFGNQGGKNMFTHWLVFHK